MSAWHARRAHPVFVAIFCAQRKHNDPERGRLAALRTHALASKAPGYAAEGSCDAAEPGITVSYRGTEETIGA